MNKKLLKEMKILLNEAKSILNEKKPHLINKLPKLSQDEKDKLIDLFSNPDNYNIVDSIKDINWSNKSLTYNEIMDKFNKQASGFQKTFKNLKEGEDYVLIDVINDWYIYGILTYKGSKNIASKKEGNIKGDWCTANFEKYWEKEVILKMNALIYCVKYDIDNPNKVAIVYNYDDNMLNSIWTSYNSHISKTKAESLLGLNIEKVI